ncbi:hypothetical protein B0T10DRAFT_551914 [Thelonectria olida]|uniref:Uncharacterized protein n=1 Tax=Thelonectria olida TaxID=1576542 RepID=A0A9P9AH93_9HYPO|nr:hypothetical protein B0T10DRAFT_551914 [Thelonectria olida]
MTKSPPKPAQQSPKNQEWPSTDDVDSLDLNIAKLLAAFVLALRTDPKCDTKAPKSEQSVKASAGRKGAQWNNCVAGDGFTQINGNRFILNSELSQWLAAKPLNPCIHNGPVKLGRGKQVNGHIIEYAGDVEGAVFPNIECDEWNDPVTLPFTSSNPGHQGSQINGIEIRIGGWKKVDGNTGL